MQSGFTKAWQDFCQPSHNCVRPSWYKKRDTPPTIVQDHPLSIQKMRGTPEQKKRQLATLNALPQSCSPGLRSRCPRSSRACPPIRWRRACRLGRKQRTARRASAPSACVPAKHPRFKSCPTADTAGFSPVETQSNSTLHQVHTWLLTSTPVSVSQIFTRWSSDPLTMRLPSREKATDRNQSK